MSKFQTSASNADSQTPGKRFFSLDAVALIGLVLSLFIFYFELFIARSASLAGDHWEQHYPWAFLLAKSLKEGVIPWWTSAIQAGFPIAAEGQIGVFYLPNLILYRFLPIHWAYSYQNVVHFLISGVGTYVYCRQMKLSPFAAWIAAFTFLFGTGYGGAFYNITSLKTICWLPWILYATEQFLATDKKRYLLMISVCLALSQLAGYLQMAAFMMVIMGFYMLLRVCFFSEKGALNIAHILKSGVALAIAIGFSFLLSAPQIWITFKLAMQSTRTELAEDYAYVGSFFPAAISTLIYPMTQALFRGASIYVGVLPLLLISMAVAVKSVRQTLFFKLWFTLTMIALLLALGEWSPLYVAIVKVTNFYSFRIPAKFMGFVCMGLAMLAGAGISALQASKSTAEEKELSQGIRGYLWFACLSLILLLGSVSLVAIFGGESLKSFGEMFVTKFVHGRAGHPHDLSTYFERLDILIAMFVEILTPWARGWNIWSYSLIVFSLFLAVMFKHMKRFTWFVVAVVFLFADLFVFSANDIKRDFGRYEDYEKKSVTVQKLLHEHEEAKVGRIYGLRTVNDALPMVPSMNMLYGIEDIGGYSPLITRRYLETIGMFGNVNDSNTAYEPKLSDVLERLPLLDFMGVTHIFSVREIKHPDFELLEKESEVGPYLYKSLRRASKVHFVIRERVLSDWDELKSVFLAPGFNPASEVLWEKGSEPAEPIQRGVGELGFEIKTLSKSSSENSWHVMTQSPGYFVVSNFHDQGWRASVNGKEASIYHAYGLFQAIRLSAPGEYEIQFDYSPWRKG